MRSRLKKSRSRKISHNTINRLRPENIKRSRKGNVLNKLSPKRISESTIFSLLPEYINNRAIKSLRLRKLAKWYKNTRLSKLTGKYPRTSLVAGYILVAIVAFSLIALAYETNLGSSSKLNQLNSSQSGGNSGSSGSKSKSSSSSSSNTKSGSNGSKNSSTGKGSTSTTTPPGSNPGPGHVAYQPSCSASDSSVSVPTAPHGIYILGNDTGSTGALINQYVLDTNNPDICGISLIVPWSEVDQGPGANPQYNWSNVDSVVNAWVAHGKLVNIVVSDASEKSPNSDTPAYVLNNPALQIVSCPTKYPVPVFWDSAFYTPYRAFMAATIAHFNSNHNIGYIRFGVGNAGEGLVEIVKNNSACMSQWTAAGYPSQWNSYYDDTLNYEHSLGSAHQLDVGLNTFDNQPSISSTASLAASLGIGIGQEGLRAIDATDILSGQPCSAMFYDWCQVEDSVAGRIMLHVQTQGPTTPAGGDASLGPLPPLLQAALVNRIQVFELQTDDALLAFDPSYNPTPNSQATYGAAYAQAVGTTAQTLGTVGGVKPEY
jgi:hypothetical protein